MGRGVKLDLSFGMKDEGWSADTICKRCKELESKCICCEQIATLPPDEHKVKVKIEKRRGKIVTIAGEFFLDKMGSAALLKMAKKRLGCGGSFKDGFLMIQGDKSEEVAKVLSEAGFYSS